MSRKAQSVVLTKSQAACVIALRNGKVSKPEIAIHGKLEHFPLMLIHNLRVARN